MRQKTEHWEREKLCLSCTYCLAITSWFRSKELSSKIQCPLSWLCLPKLWPALVTSYFLSLLTGRESREEERGWRKEKDFPDHLFSQLIPLLLRPSLSHLLSQLSLSPLFQIVTKCKTQREKRRKKERLTIWKPNEAVNNQPQGQNIPNIHHTINDIPFCRSQWKILFLRSRFAYLLLLQI